MALIRFRYIRSSSLAGLLLMGLAHAAVAQLEVSDAWVRAMPPGQRMTAAYLNIENTGTEAVTLTGVSSERGDASLHETRTEDGRSRMRAVDELNLPVSQRLAFRPGGMHIMIMGLEETPREGESLRLCLETSIGETCFPAPVRKGPPAGGAHH